MSRPHAPNTASKMRASIRCAGVAIAICSWVALSNHCAFAAVATDTDKEQTECPFHSKPAKQKDQTSQMQCCRVLRAVFSAENKSWMRDDAKSREATLSVQTVELLACWLRTTAPLLLETGPPPGAFSFAESILQQSLLAHAPPFVA
jgi:hypothetical protein